MQIYPTKIKRSEENNLEIIWSDGKESSISLKTLRDECPCANCKGESVILDTYIPLKNAYKPAGFYEIEKIEKTGNYAITIIWKDGHDTGIYSFELLRQLCIR